MINVISTERVPIKFWIDDIDKLDPGAIEQAKNLANLPFVHKHIAIMPDAHQGYGMPIGGVMATKGVIIPNAVGVDIGCGMCAAKTTLTELNKHELQHLIDSIRRNIPVGFKKHLELQDESLMPKVEDLYALYVVSTEYDNALKSLGTLGGGNHFIEIQQGDDGYIWVMVHSGSRNLGKQIAEYHNKVAITLNKRWFSQVPKEWQLAFLPLDSQQGQDYLAEMNFAVEYALANRMLMMDRISKFIPLSGFMINIAHNYAIMENHFGTNVMVHRKGATQAREGTIGIIPGSQGTKSYIVEGVGNPMSFNSCSHGAGRVMSRTRAKKELDLDAEIKKLDDLGIIHSIRTKDDLDEASSAYKSIAEVMSNQVDLVNVRIELAPLAVVKG